MYGIIRIDHDKSHTYCWVVTISRRKKQYLKHFSDGVYGGKQKAHAAAKAYRDEIIAAHRPMTMKEFCSIVKSSNRSGVSGVNRLATKNSHNKNILHWYWVAGWSPEPGQTKHVKFSINKYGEEKAFRMAVRARKKALAEVQGYFIGKIKSNARTTGSRLYS
jgi:hypothetical protein